MRHVFLLPLVLSLTGCLTPLTERLDQLNQHLGELAQQLDETNRRLANLESKLGETNQRLDQMERHLQRMSGLSQLPDSPAAALATIPKP